MLVPNLNQLLEKYGLKANELTGEERETLETWEQRFSIKELQMSDLSTYVDRMIASVSYELAGIGDSPSLAKWLVRKKRDVHLKARLQNYLMLKEFLASPERAREFMEERLKQMGENKA